jgi:hypothetical protein
MSICRLKNDGRETAMVATMCLTRNDFATEQGRLSLRPILPSSPELSHWNSEWQCLFAEIVCASVVAQKSSNEAESTCCLLHVEECVAVATSQDEIR